MLCRWTLTSTLLFTHLQFMSSHHHQHPPCCLTPSASWRRRDGVRRTKRRKASGLMHIFYLAFPWSWSSSRLSLTGSWHHWRTCFELTSTELMVESVEDDQLKATEKRGDLELRYFCHWQHRLFKWYVYAYLTKPSWWLMNVSTEHVTCTGETAIHILFPNRFILTMNRIFSLI